MIVSRSGPDNLKKASWIRRMFEEGARLKQEFGAARVFDFTLGNPEIERPPRCWPRHAACSTAARATTTSTCPMLWHRLLDGQRLLCGQRPSTGLMLSPLAV